MKRSEMVKTVFLLAVMLGLMGCTPDPRQDAAAYQTLVLADQQALDATQARAQAADLHQVDMAKALLDQQNRLAAQKNWQMVQGWMILALGVAAVVAILAAGGSVSYAVAGFSKAFVRYAEIRAEVQGNLIGMDRATRTFPLLRHVRGNVYALSNPNTDSVRLLDVSKDADRQMITALAGVAMAGVQYSETGKANSPQDMSMIQTPLVDARVPGLQVGSNIFSQALNLLNGDPHEDEEI